MDKSTAVLYIYDALLNGQELTIAKISEACDCSNRTSIRYMNAVRKYLLAYHDINVVYSRRTNSFMLKK